MRADAQPPLPHSPAKLPDDIRRYARELRTSQTDAESLLWHLLRNRHFLDLKFRRQHPENRYILDFYCDELKLAIELDGSQHIEQADYDQARTEFLAKHGIRVLRFWNNQVLAETEGVMEAIYQAVMEMQAPSTDSQKAIVSNLVDAILAGMSEVPRFEQLINGLVFELFFPDDLHRANIRLFDACEKAGVSKLATLTPTPLPLTGEGLTACSPRPLAGEGLGVREIANDLATRIFANDHPIFGMLFDLQGLDVVRIIEGRE